MPSAINPLERMDCSTQAGKEVSKLGSIENYSRDTGNLVMNSIRTVFLGLTASGK